MDEIIKNRVEITKKLDEIDQKLYITDKKINNVNTSFKSRFNSDENYSHELNVRSIPAIEKNLSNKKYSNDTEEVSQTKFDQE